MSSIIPQTSAQQLGVSSSNLSHNESTYDHSKLSSNFIGINTIENAPESEVKDFVKSHGGHTVIQSVSIKFENQYQCYI